jgi:hypothetical protein
MKWHLRGESYACCSCSVGCPCATGEMETTGSDGCCAVQIMDIQSGEIGDIDVSGTKVAAVVDWPGAMMAGRGTGRLYFDIATSQLQRTALESLISGQLGGGFSRMPELVPKVLPAILAPIRKAQVGGDTSIQVEGFGEARVKPIRLADGDSPRIQGTGGFRSDVALATGMGSWWSDPDLRHWVGGGYAERNEFDWQG